MSGSPDQGNSPSCEHAGIIGRRTRLRLHCPHIRQTPEPRYGKSLMCKFASRTPEACRLSIPLRHFASSALGPFARARPAPGGSRRRAPLTRALSWFGTTGVELLESPGAAFDADPKTDAGKRTVAVPPHVLPFLQEHMSRWAGPDRVFVGRDGRAMRGDAIRQAFTRARRKVGMPGFRFMKRKRDAAGP